MSKILAVGRRWSLFDMIACHHHHRPDGKCRATIFFFVGRNYCYYYRVIWCLVGTRRPFSPSKFSPENKIKQNKKDKTKFAQTLKANYCLAPKISGPTGVPAIFISFLVRVRVRFFSSSSPLLIRRSSKLQNKLLIQKFIRLVRENLFGHRHLIITPFFSLLFCWFHLCQHRIRGSPPNVPHRKMPFVVNFIIVVVITPHDSLVCNSAGLMRRVECTTFTEKNKMKLLRMSI